MKRENLSRSHSKGVVILIAIVIAIQSIVLILKSSGYFKEPLVPVNRVIVDSVVERLRKLLIFLIKSRREITEEALKLTTKGKKRRKFSKSLIPI